MDGKYLLGGMMIGDTKDYVKLVPMVKNKRGLGYPSISVHHWRIERWR